MAGLFKKKKKEKPEEQREAEKPIAPEEVEVSETLIEEGDLQSILGDMMKNTGLDEISERLEELTRKIDEIQARMERHDSLISSLENEISEIRSVNEEMQDNIKRLLDVYEIVSQKINPFIDMNGKNEAPSPETIVPASTFMEEMSPMEEKPQGRLIEVDKSTREEYTEKRNKDKRNKDNEFKKSGPILREIKKDYYTIVLLMRWIEFLFERVKRDKITLLLDYYVDIGWISKEVKSEIMAYARGEVQDVTKYFPEEEIEAEIETPAGTIKTPEPKIYRRVDDWRLSAEDHLKSLLFIMKIAGVEVNKDRLNSLEQEIEKFKKSLWEFHGV